MDSNWLVLLLVIAVLVAAFIYFNDMSKNSGKKKSTFSTAQTGAVIAPAPTL